jgi:hypothetical protein
VPNSKGWQTVYVSSTFIDLQGHRAALKAALEKARYDVECMEKYTAFDQPPLDRCLADVAATDVYVLLIAHRYGYRPPENNPQRRSITQLERRQSPAGSAHRLAVDPLSGCRCVDARGAPPKWSDVSGGNGTIPSDKRASVKRPRSVRRP